MSNLSVCKAQSFHGKKPPVYKNESLIFYHVMSFHHNFSFPVSYLFSSRFQKKEHLGSSFCSSKLQREEIISSVFACGGGGDDWEGKRAAILQGSMGERGNPNFLNGCSKLTEMIAEEWRRKPKQINNQKDKTHK